MYQNGYGYVQLRPSPREQYPQYTFNEQTSRFERDGHATTSPDVVVLFDSALGVYTSVPPAIAALVDANYSEVAMFTGIVPSREGQALYDRDDAFFAPFGGIENARRPGPNIRMFERRAPR